MKFSGVKKGMVLVVDGDLVTVHDLVHGTPGNLRAFYQVKLKSLAKGTVVQRRFSAADDVEMAYLDTRPMEYLYRQGDRLCFMDTETYDQVMLPVEDAGDAVNYLTLNMEVKVKLHEGRVVAVDLPSSVVLTVKETGPSTKGDTVSNVFKPATLDTGIVVKVPLYISQGEKVRVDTRTGEFLERAG
jgi:elongation factor P